VKRRQKRKIVALAILVLLLALVGLWYFNFRATKNLSFDLTATPADTITAPTYLYSFAGSGANHMQQPIGVLADSGSVYVSDAKAGVILQFRENGTFVRSFGKGKLQTPLYMAKNPKDGNIYVADRRGRKVQIFKPTGEYVGVFDPKLPKAQLPQFDTKGDQWVPIALDFAPDGTLYVIELLNGHRMLVFGPDGAFKKSVGHAGLAGTADSLPESFQFPNSVKVHGNEVWVSDSNNRRMQVFNLAGDFKRIVAVAGLPRGMAFLPRSSNATSGTPDKFVVVDTLSHDGTIFTAAGEKILSFGTRGVLEGQFSYPNDVSVGTNSLLFITDTNNLRVQVWGWPENLSPIPRILPRQPAWCLALLPLLLLPLFFRKKKFFATADFIEAALDAGLLAKLPDRRRRWLVSEQDYEALRDRSQDEILLAELLSPDEYSETDASALEAKMGIDRSQSAPLVSAKRAKVFCTEDADLRKMARILEIDVVNLSEFLERFAAEMKKNAD
jgi:DNA-binding beta-propeller fold protein YncE